MLRSLFRCLSRRWFLPILCCVAFIGAIACTPADNASVVDASPQSAEAVPVSQVTAPSPNLAVGTNLAGVTNWSTELPFLDAFKSSRSWLTQCVSSDPGCSGQFNTRESDRLDLDEYGWVRSLPSPADPPEFTRVSTLLFREINGRYPGGQYVVLYDGEGTLEYSFDAQKDAAASRPGRDVINVTPSDQGILLSVVATDPQGNGNYLRNIRVVPIAYEATYEDLIFNPEFLERVRPFQAIRLMNWMDTNHSTQQEWENRPKVEDATYSRRGVPIEIMVELANRLGADPWFCMPHQATDEYIRNFAQQVKEQLDPSLTAYAEFSNEVWNWQFDQAHYAKDQAQERWGEEGNAYMQWYGMRSAQMSDLWSEVFADQRDRLKTVISTQTAWRGLEEPALNCPLWVAEGNTPCYQHQFDTYAITGYFSGNMTGGDNSRTVETWARQGEEGFSKAFQQLSQGGLLEPGNRDSSLVGILDSFQYHAQVAQNYGLELSIYEAGQHLVKSDNETLTEFFIALNRRPEMYDLYLQLLENWKSSGGGLYMNFLDIAEPSKWGSWGVLEYLDQESSPKYDALLEFIRANELQST